MLTAVGLRQRSEWRSSSWVHSQRGRAQHTHLGPCVAFTNVHCHGFASPTADLPRFLAAHADVAWLPLQCNTYTRHMFPMKFFEYLFAGLPVVSTRIHALRSFEAIWSVALPSGSGGSSAAIANGCWREMAQAWSSD